MESKPTKNSWGCLLISVLGCFGILVVIGMLATLIVYFGIRQSKDDSYRYNYNANLNNNYNGNNQVTNQDFGDQRAYQIVAYPGNSYAEWSYPSIQTTIPYAKTAPLPTGDHGYLWVGATLSNGYFVQVGMSTSERVDADGNMIWNYFWQVWDNNNTYLYGYEDYMTESDWDLNADNTFTLTCQNPDTGTWEFWVNQKTIGTASTGSCNMDLKNASVAWEVVTTKTPQDTLPTFGPFQIGTMEYWDGYSWLNVTNARLTYGYGLINEGTIADATSVCPPYGVAAAEDNSGFFTAGSTLSCLSPGELLWAWFPG